MKHRGRDRRLGFYSAILVILTLKNRIIYVLEPTESINEAPHMRSRPHALHIENKVDNACRAPHIGI